MREFFRGWKRKIGCVTLVMALVFMGGWLRSLGRGEFLNFENSQLMSFRGGLFWERWTGKNTFEFGYCVDDSPFLDDPYQHRGWDDQWRWRWLGFGVTVGEMGISASPVPQALVAYRVPYWSIIGPLTLLSAFLLLSKPRKTIQSKIPEPIANEGA